MYYVKTLECINEWYQYILKNKMFIYSQILLYTSGREHWYFC